MSGLDSHTEANTPEAQAELRGIVNLMLADWLGEQATHLAAQAQTHADPEAQARLRDAQATAAQATTAEAKK